MNLSAVKQLNEVLSKERLLKSAQDHTSRRQIVANYYNVKRNNIKQNDEIFDILFNSAICHVQSRIIHADFNCA